MNAKNEHLSSWWWICRFGQFDWIIIIITNSFEIIYKFKIVSRAIDGDFCNTQIERINSAFITSPTKLLINLYYYYNLQWFWAFFDWLRLSSVLDTKQVLASACVRYHQSTCHLLLSLCFTCFEFSSTWKHCLDVCVWLLLISFSSKFFLVVKSIEIDWSIDWLIQESASFSFPTDHFFLPFHGSLPSIISLVPHVSLTQSLLLLSSPVLLFWRHCLISLPVNPLIRTLHFFLLSQQQQQTTILMSGWLISN